MSLRDLSFEEQKELEKKVEKEDDARYILREDDLWLNTVEELFQVRLQLSGYDKLLEKERNLKEMLQHLSMNKECRGGGIKLKKISRKGFMDLSLVPGLWGRDLEQYRKPPTEYWQVVEDV